METSLDYPFPLISTCYDMLAALPLPIKALTLGSFKTISDTGTFSILSSTQRLIRRDLKSCEGKTIDKKTLKPAECGL
jgi:hypothetical protein